MDTRLRVFDAQPYRVIFDEKELRISPNKSSEIIKVLQMETQPHSIITSGNDILLIRLPNH
jgi:hypothetical protein